MQTPQPRLSRAERRQQSEARILDAARRMFAEHGYDRTTIRGIAAEADVDAGLVMHYFGSKEQLFLQCTDDALQPPVAASAAEIADFLVEALDVGLRKEPSASLAVLRSMLTHPDAAKAVHTTLGDFLKPITEAIPSEDAALRANLAAALILGVNVARNLLEFEGLKDASEQDIARILRPCIHALVYGEPPPDASPDSE